MLEVTGMCCSGTDAIEFMEGLWRMAAMVILSQRKRWSGICDERE
jgi:hypothetical protein|nr:hypothetical protein [uncultured Acetatifactor sp.]